MGHGYMARFATLHTIDTTMETAIDGSALEGLLGDFMRDFTTRSNLTSAIDVIELAQETPEGSPDYQAASVTLRNQHWWAKGAGHHVGERRAAFTGENWADRFQQQ